MLANEQWQNGANERGCDVMVCCSAGPDLPLLCVCVCVWKPCSASVHSCLRMHSSWPTVVILYLYRNCRPIFIALPMDLVQDFRRIYFQCCLRDPRFGFWSGSLASQICSWKIRSLRWICDWFATRGSRRCVIVKHGNSVQWIFALNVWIKKETMNNKHDMNVQNMSRKFAATTHIHFSLEYYEFSSSFRPFNCMRTTILHE